MISSLLKAETAHNHKKLESLMFVDGIMNNSLSVEQYKKLLVINYLIHQKLENKLANMLNSEVAIELDMNGRLKLSALEKDLKYWEIDNLTLPGLNFELYIPKKDTAQVLGALYVLEGATLGGNVIKRHILSNSSFSGAEAGLNYYGVYGLEIGSKWKTFLEVLNSHVAENDYQACINSANLMFENLIHLAEQLK